MSCKKQFGNAKSIDNLSKVIAQKCQSKKKSLSQALLAKSNKTINNINDTKNRTIDNSKIGTCQQTVTTPKTGIKIVPKYHTYDNRFLGWNIEIRNIESLDILHLWFIILTSFDSILFYFVWIIWLKYW